MTQENQEKDMLAPIPGLTVEGENKAQELSPFELKNQLIDLAGEDDRQVLNAGRGNPNFFNAPARLALCKLTEFAIDISAPLPDNPHIKLTPHKPDSTSGSLYNQFINYFKGKSDEGSQFLTEAVTWAIENLHLNEQEQDEFLYELTDAARGDFYPGSPPSDYKTKTNSPPPRILKYTQRIVNKYLEQVLLSGGGGGSLGEFDLFATEGATAGMLYVFNSLMENFILNKKDKVAVITPVFSPYLEIPTLNDYDFDLIYIDTDQDKPWQIKQTEIDKLKDPQVKALYLINPTNPTSVALSQDTLDKLQAVVENDNKNLIILVDAVYATFVNGFQSIIKKMPRNCITVYSFSKYFGVTGWRLGAIMLNRKNVIDDMIQDVINQNARKKEALEQRYLIDSEEPSKLYFIDRLCLDSREVALAHTGGIACPGQAAMSLFALYNLKYQEKYKPSLRTLLNDRITRLYKQLQLNLPVDPGGGSENQTYYYALVDILEMAEKKHSDPDFPIYLLKRFYPVDFVFQLAYQKSSVCLPGYGFFEKEKIDESSITPEDRNNWSIRVSLANLETDDYPTLGKNISDILEQYYIKYQREKVTVKTVTG